MTVSLAAVLAQRATRDPERAFLLSQQGRMTFGEADSQAEALAAALHGLGVEAGDRIALLLPPCPEFVVATFAAAKLGAVVVPLNPRLPGPELRYLLRHSEAVVAVTVETFEDVDYLQLFENLFPHLPELQYLVTVGEEDLWYDDRIFQYEDLLSSGQGRDYAAAAAEGDAADEVFGLLYTSGTTGKPKGVLLTHRNLVGIAEAAVDRLGIGPDDRIVGLSALFHVFGLGQGLIGSIVSGATLVLDASTDGPTTLDLIENHRATVQYGTPTLYETQLLEQATRPRDLSSLRLALVSGAPVPTGLPERVEAATGATVVLGYSVTETGALVSATSSREDAAARHFTVGSPLAGVEVRIVAEASVPDAEREAEEGELPPESVGEIAVRGIGVMKGYYRQPMLTASSIDDEGFFRTGDLGMLDEIGLLHLVGRHREVIIRAGHNVHPREVENRLGMHPAVQDVAVVGLPDPILGETISACVVPVEGAIVTEDELKEWCRATLADHKTPDLVRLFDAFPMTGTGKVRRVEVARLLREAVQADT